MRNNFTFLHSFTIAVIALILAGCNSRQPQYVVGVSQCWDDAWRQKMNNEMDCEALRHPELRLHRRVSLGDTELQCAHIDSFISEKVDALIISPSDAEQVKPAVTRAYKAGIPVIIADRRISGEEWTAFIGGDNYRVGQLMAEWVNTVERQKSKVESSEPSPLHVLEVQGMHGSMPEQLRHQGLTDGINGKINLQSVAGYIDAYTEVSRYLSSHKNIDAIVAQNDIMAIESAKAVRDAEGYGKGSVRIMGVDGITVGLQAIANGDIECSAVYPTRGDLLVTTAAAILSGAPFVRDTVIETTMVDATMAPLLLRQFELRTHDLETMQMVNKLAETNLHNIRIDRNLLIIAFIVVSALLLLALLYVLYRQTMMQTKINRTIRQVEDVQEAIQLNHRDAAFAERMRQIIDSHLTDPKLNVEYLATALQLDRTQVFRRVKSVTGKGPAEYIREQRLIRANEQLRTTDKSIRQIANELCFSSPGYFSKYYKEYFGHLPSEQ